MTLDDQLIHYKRTLDTDIAIYSQALLKSTTAEYGTFSHDTVAAFTDVLARGGKRLRGALVMASYEMFHGQDGATILQAARAIEMIHAYLLIIDDIADNSAVRRGGPSAHIYMQRHHQQQKFHGSSEHFGASTATYAALLGFYEAEGVLLSLDVTAETKILLLKQLQNTLVKTYHGQLLDTYNEASQTDSEADALRVSQLKTAYYSLVNPLQIGAQLAGATTSDLAMLQEYGKNAGIAFQISDDIIGIFGDDTKTGKSAKDDLREGKRTILITYSLTHASAASRQQLLEILGKNDISDAELAIARQVISQAGGLTFAQDQIKRYVKKSQASLAVAPASWNPEKLTFLSDLAASLASRQT